MNPENYNKPHFIYALYLSGIAVYVGCTQNIKRRITQQKNNPKLKSLFSKLKIVILVTAKNRRDGHKKETIIVSYLKSKNQCEFNEMPSYSASLLYDLERGRRNWTEENFRLAEKLINS